MLILIFCLGCSCITTPLARSLLSLFSSSDSLQLIPISSPPPTPHAFSLDSPPLMERAIPDLSSCNSVNEWLDTIKMSRYKDHFAAGGYHTLGHVIGMNQG